MISNTTKKFNFHSLKGNLSNFITVHALVPSSFWITEKRNLNLHLATVSRRFWLHNHLAESAESTRVVAAIFIIIYCNVWEDDPSRNIGSPLILLNFFLFEKRKTAVLSGTGEEEYHSGCRLVSDFTEIARLRALRCWWCKTGPIATRIWACHAVCT